MHTQHLWRPKLLDSLRGYDRATFWGDLASGLTIGVLALPLALGFAIASGMPPMSGVWTSIIGGFIAALLSGSRVLVSGPTGAFIPILYGISVSYGTGNLMLATLLAGLILIGIALLRLGNLIRYMPVTVISGFSSGIAVIILLSQIKDFLGLRVEHMPAEFIGKMHALYTALPTLHVPTAALALCCFVFLFLYNQFCRHHPLLGRLPGPLVTLILGTIACSLLDLPKLGVETLGSRFGVITADLPGFNWPGMEWSYIGKQISPAISIALLCAFESLLSARITDDQVGDRHRPNQELMAQGFANVGSALCGGFALSAALSRTTTSIRAGARTPIAALLHSFLLLMMVVIAAPLAADIPLAVLSAIVSMVAFHMGGWQQFRQLHHYSVHYRAVMLTTFALTVLFSVTVAVEVGVILAGILFIYRMQELTEVHDLPFEKPNTRAYSLRGALFFGSVARVETTIHPSTSHNETIVLDLSGLILLDNSGIEWLDKLTTSLTQHQGSLVLIGLNTQPRQQLERHGSLEGHHAPRLFADWQSAVSTLLERP